jgi:HEPN domain-containing protein
MAISMSNKQRAKEFIKMARADWEAAMASSVPYSICFHAQQVAEKYLKAFLEYHGQQVPKRHNMADLINRCASIDPSMSSLLPYADSLQPFAVEIRYAPSKEIADEKCPEVWSAMSAILNEIKKKMHNAEMYSDSDLAKE